MSDIEYEWVCGDKSRIRILKFLQEIDDMMIPCLSDRVDITEYASKLAGKAYTLFAVKDECDIASSSVYYDTKNAYITSIAVKAAFLQQHIGTEMLQEIKSYAKDRQCRNIHLEVYQDNIPALAFYKKNGFYNIGETGKWLMMEYRLADRE